MPTNANKGSEERVNLQDLRKHNNHQGSCRYFLSCMAPRVQNQPTQCSGTHDGMDTNKIFVAGDYKSHYKIALATCKPH